MQTITRADQGRTVELRVADTMVIQLAENPTTGFVWAVDQVSAGCLRLVASEYEPSAGSVGVGGERRFTFKAVEAGIVKLELKLWREWEGDKSVADGFTVTVAVV